MGDPLGPRWITLPDSHAGSTPDRPRIDAAERHKIDAAERHRIVLFASNATVPR